MKGLGMPPGMGQGMGQAGMKNLPPGYTMKGLDPSTSPTYQPNGGFSFAEAFGLSPFLQELARVQSDIGAKINAAGGSQPFQMGYKIPAPTQAPQAPTEMIQKGLPADSSPTYTAPYDIIRRYTGQR